MKTIVQNGVEIQLTNDEYKQYVKESKERLAEAERIMHEAYLKDMQEANMALNRSITYSLIDEKSVVKQKVLKTMIRPFTTKEDLEYRKWLYNDGKLRSNWDVEEYKRQHKFSKYRNSTNFNTSSKITNILSFLIPLILCMLFIMSKPGAMDMWLFSIPIAILVSCFFCYISMMIGYSININRGKRNGLSDSDPRMTDERHKRNIGAVTGAVTGVSTYRHAKKSVKEVLDVDNWKVMK